METEMKPEIEDLLRQGDIPQLQNKLAGLEPSQIGALCEELTTEESFIVFRSLPGSTAAQVFEYWPEENRVTLTESLSLEGDLLPALLNDLSPDVRTSFFSELPETEVQRFLSLLNPKERKNAIRLLSYPKDSIGRLAGGVICG